jgi:hypothetical protein
MKLYQLCLALAALSAGCSTSLTVKRFNEKDPTTAVGSPFPLMFTQYEVAVVRQVVSCGARLKLKVTAEIKGNKAAPDPNQLFVLDTSSLSSPLKTSEVKTTYHPTGAVATLNATAEDKSAPVVANVAQTIAKVVSIAAMAGAPLPAPGAKPEVCEASTIAALCGSVGPEEEGQGLWRSRRLASSQAGGVDKEDQRDRWQPRRCNEEGTVRGIRCAGLCFK